MNTMELTKLSKTEYLSMTQVAVKKWIVNRDMLDVPLSDRKYVYGRIMKETSKAYLVIFVHRLAENEYVKLWVPKSQCKLIEYIDDLEKYSYNEFAFNHVDLEKYYSGLVNNINLIANTVCRVDYINQVSECYEIHIMLTNYRYACYKLPLNEKGIEEYTQKIIDKLRSKDELCYEI